MSLDIAVSSTAASDKGVDDDDVASLVLAAAVPLVIPSRTDSVQTKLFSIALAVFFANSCQSHPELEFLLPSLS